MEDENGGASLEANFGTRVAEIQQRLRQKCGGIDMQGGQCCHSCQDVTTVTVFPALRLCLRCEYEMLGSVVIREIWRESNVKKKDDRLVITPGGKS